jgi:bifunctional non-homologous end joining protein LigD
VAKARDDSLGRYDEKRDFERTPEPPAKRPKRKKGAPPIFVVHRHEARRLHYDLRLERDGVLLSWAVPKGFSYDPADKHLAMRTEDHPLEYEDFHGVIPKGEYGAGTMQIWDRGRVTFLNGAGGPEAGEVKLLLFGRRLRGEWHLVQTKQGPNTWLIFKSRDRYAGVRRDSALGADLSKAEEGPLPATLVPMEPGETSAPFTDPQWLFEARFAGQRVLARKDGDAVALVGEARAPAGVLADLAKIRAEKALLDGVLVALDEHERPSKALLAERLAAGGTGVVFHALDLLHFEDYDLRPLATLERKAALRGLLPPLAHVLFTDHVLGRGEDLVAAVRAAGLPGVIAKRGEAPYTAGKSADWRSIPVAGEVPGGKRAPVAVRKALKKSTQERARSRVAFTNLDKVYWPAEGFTKGDLLAYYEQVAEVLLPYLRGRPIHLNRFPDGIAGKSFYQKEAKDGTPEWVRTVTIGSKSRAEKSLRYMVCDDRDTLLYLVNLGSIDLHPWMSRVESQDSPDWAVIDLDPKEAPFTDVIRIAREVGRLLRGIGLKPYLKTSGSTGLHVFVGLKPGYTYQHSEMFCEGVARIVARDLPEIATVERSLAERGGKVYIDFGQNRKGQTVVPPYVLRPVRGASVSTPLAWDELEGDLQIAHFTLQNVPERLERLGDLFRPVLSEPQDLGPAIEALQGYWKGRR